MKRSQFIVRRINVYGEKEYMFLFCKTRREALEAATRVDDFQSIEVYP